MRSGLLLPIASAAQAAALAASLGMSADAVPCSRGALVLPRSGALEEQQVQRASRTLRSADVLALRLADERVAVERWRAGRLVDTPAYGLVGGVDGDAERVLLGWLPVQEAAGVASTDGVDQRTAARAALAAAVGPVTTWQVVLASALVVIAVLLSAAAVADVVLGERGVWSWVQAVAWPLVALFWSASLRGLLRRRRAERS
ncbi:hypothetical protein [Quadrisphaera sp. DSM 44207]|uniref:hypothetical protein n=1 Tax=Quadrisphaera sp. DSM 44207 TaxID=1881057 RepID=UPI00088CD84C|nr:hypothetical protein [Quadrisphaera sp. DSM 44207]SDQ52844.1 hypothetical protein SAMN05428996_2055 [Quadrisphaera sp. DSM 44207]